MEDLIICSTNDATGRVVTRRLEPVASISMLDPWPWSTRDALVKYVEKFLAYLSDQLVLQVFGTETSAIGFELDNDTLDILSYSTTSVVDDSGNVLRTPIGYEAQWSIAGSLPIYRDGPGYMVDVASFVPGIMVALARELPGHAIVVNGGWLHVYRESDQVSGAQ